MYSQSGPQGNASGPYSPFINPANPGETSLPWGWTHTPALGIQIDGNTFVDPSASAPTTLGVDHSVHTHANIGRRYYTGQLENNLFVVSNPPGGSDLTVVQVGKNAVNASGQSVTADPYELSVIASNNTEIVPASFSSAGWNAVISAVAGTVNHQTTPQSIVLNAATIPGVVDLAPYMNQVGLTADNATSPGNLDGGGYSYSSTAMGGSVVDWAGSTYVLGLAGQNNVVQAAGQTIPLPSGFYTSLRLLGAAVNGARSGSFTIHYTDGTTSVVTQSFSDWAYPASYPNESIVARMPYRNRATNNGQDLRSMYLYGYTLPLVPGKIAQSIQLPVNGNIKILAMDLLGPRPQVSLSNSLQSRRLDG